MNSEAHDEEQHEGLHFLFDSREEILHQPGVFVPISVLIHSPFVHPHGSRQLISFLDSLPYRSVVIVGDSIQRHTIMAVKGKGKRKMSMEEARQMALKLGNMYAEVISNAIKENKSVTENKKIALVRWDDIMDENKGKQETIIHEYYMNNTCFRERVDVLAMEFLNQRTPSSRYFLQRRTHSVNYILGELALFVTGISYEGQRYQTLVYATSTITFEKTKANLDKTLWSLVYDILEGPLFADLKRELVDADDGIEAHHGWPILSTSPKPVGQTEIN